MCLITSDSAHSVAATSEENIPLHTEAANPSNTVTRNDLRDLTQRIAYGLRHEYGIGSNGPNKDVVTVISYGQPLVAAAFYGVIAAGGVYSAASPSSTVADLTRQVTIGTSRLIVCSAEFKELATRTAKACSIPLNRILVLESSPLWRLASIYGGIDVISEQKLSWQKITDPETLKKSLITILWSSGTTGLPKGKL